MTWTPEQRRAYAREWQRKRREDPEYREKQNSYVRRWREQNPGKSQGSAQRSRELNREKIAWRAREEYAQDPEKYRERTRRYRDEHLEERRAYNRDYARQNRASAREYKLIRQYGVTAAEYDAILESQGGGCALCGAKPVPGRKSLAIDHDHTCCPGHGSCGKCIRGVLCDKHNLALGLLGDIGQLQAAIEYLQRPYWAGSAE